MKASSVPFSTCERDFLLEGIKSRKRIDGREAYDYRKLRILFGVDRGHCEVQLGETRVLAQVSCEVVQPKPNRPTEGQLFLNVELSPMASPAFESGRMTEFGTELNRFMERCYVESRAIDVESLCIVAGEKVWSIRVDVHVLDNGGNIADCASIAAVTALAHFRRPDVSVIGEDVTIYSPEDRDPVPLSILHMPVCITFGFFNEGQQLLVDPTDKEEIVMDGRMIMAMNIHREICGAVMGGGVSLESEQILRCSKIASVKVTEIVALIQEALEEDSKQRALGKTGLIESDTTPSIITVTSADESEVDISGAVEKVTGEWYKRVIHYFTLYFTERQHDDMTAMEENPWGAQLKGPGTAQIGEGGDNSWIVLDEEDGEMEESEEVEITGEERNSESPTPESQQKNGSKVVHSIVDNDDSEEEDVIILTAERSDVIQKSSQPMRTQETLGLSGALKSDSGKNSNSKKKKRKRISGNRTSQTS
ncbi:exosome complex component RRP45-like [Pocillopora damicornis]|uniref:exosome complex component RRP45-like n=1 Tax=Pocillopora damicornis TaxID=46731 RepID=UPI000F54E1D4|nr:exosome complex component RRP45-like [Pocillopora damicornis]